MKTRLSNLFLIFGLVLYTLAGIAAISKMSYSIIALLAATIFLAFGFFVNVKLRWVKSFKKRTKS
ncbi:MAG: hypothetical protein QF798_03155 [Candidatus Woesearchaeota archaeon]|jgi:hypothetical protein|nr:hypothetical protein [Candidatus Woesearchaeota archaeon]|tara:strand:- start:259 stop:453 length:195 start_codon:yes stop_codon:yes gene_type:complete